MNLHEILDGLAATNSRTDKEQIIFRAFMSGHRDFFTGAKLALDPLITFGVQKVALIEDADDEVGSLFFSDFLDLSGKLARRELTGHAARDAINAAAQIANAKTWNNFYRRILLKDLSLGVESKTINKVLKKIKTTNPEALDYMVPIFGCQLAHDGADHEKKIVGRKMLDVKLDGVRLLTILDKDAGTVVQYTRNGKRNENFTQITNNLRSLMDEIKTSVVLDGEIVSETFQSLMTQVNRKSDVATNDAKLALFDIIPLKDFNEGVCRISQEERHELLTEFQTSGLLDKHCGKSVYVIPKRILDLSTDTGQESFAEFNAEAIAAGFEGIMIKDPKAPYECKRSVAWLKVKPFISVDLEIIGFEQGKEGKYQNVLGALVCRGYHSDKLVETNVGTGLTDDQRKDFWDNREKLLGAIVEIKADALTQDSTKTDVWSLRFPRFERFRSMTGDNSKI